MILGLPILGGAAQMGCGNALLGLTGAISCPGRGQNVPAPLSRLKGR